MALTDKLTAIADGFRTSRGTEQKYTLDEMAVLAAEKVGGGGAGLNIAYGNTAPDDTTKLWVKAEEPSAVVVSSGLNFEPTGIEEIGNMEQGGAGVACAAVGNKIYLFGGMYQYNKRTNSIRVYDTVAKTIETLSVTLSSQYAYLATGVVGTKIYLFAGQEGSGYYKRIHIFDTETNTIQTLSDTLPVVACYGLASATVGTSIYLFGGAGNSYYNHIVKFDTVTNTATKLDTALPNSFYLATAVAFETKVYIFGGKGSNTYNSIFVFDTEKQTISTLDVTLPTATYGMSSALFGSKIYLIGGSSVKTINVFDIETQTIETLESGSAYKLYDTGIAVVGDSAYIFGGCDWSTAQYPTTIHKFSASAQLESNNMALIYTTGKANAFIINSDALTIEANVKSAYIGDASGAAQPVEAFIYKDDAWTAI